MAQLTVKYDGSVPKTLRTYCDKHAHQISEVAGRRQRCCQ